MKDQCFNRPLPGRDIQEIKQAFNHLDGIDSIFRKLAGRNPKLAQVINDDCYFKECHEKLEECVHQINSDLQELDHDELLHPWDKLAALEIKNMDSTEYL